MIEILYHIFRKKKLCFLFFPQKTRIRGMDGSFKGQREGVDSTSDVGFDKGRRF